MEFNDAKTTNNFILHYSCKTVFDINNGCLNFFLSLS